MSKANLKRCVFEYDVNIGWGGVNLLSVFFLNSLSVRIRVNLGDQARRALLEREVDQVPLVAEVTTPRMHCQ